MYIFSVAVLVVALGSTVHSIPRLGDMIPAFTTARAGTGGSCDSDNMDKLKITFSEAVSAMQHAIEAIDNLKENRHFVISPKKKRTWKRQAQLLKTLFNVDLDKPHKLAANNPGAELVKSKPNEHASGDL